MDDDRPATGPAGPDGDALADRRSRPARRRPPAAVVAGAVGVLLIVAVTAVLGLSSGWRATYVAPVLPDADAVALGGPGAVGCAPVPGVPAAGGRAELRLGAGGPASFRGRIEVRTPTRVLQGPVETVARNGDVVRLALPRDGTGGRPAQVCVISEQAAPVVLRGTPGGPALRLVGREPQTWLSQLGTMLGRSAEAKGQPLHALGGWGPALLGIAAIGLAIGLAVRALADERWRPRRRTWAAVALVGLLHAWTWAALLPVFQVPDEVSHYQYVAYVADHGELPEGRLDAPPWGSPGQERATALLHTTSVQFHPALKPPWTAAEGRRIRDEVGRAGSDVPDVHTNATDQPPLYYLSVVPAALGGGDALDQLARIRLLSGLWMAVAALGAVALVRQLAPARPRWALIAGLGVALFPLLGFLAGGVTPDVAMAALSLWAFAAAARCWRRPTPGAVALAAALLTLAVLTKLTALALVPGVLAIVIGALVRQWRSGERATVRAAATTGVVAAAIPAVAYAAAALASGRSLIPGVLGDAVEGRSAGAATGGDLLGSLNSTWQLFLPRLPFLADEHPGEPIWSVWTDGLVGRFGVLDYGFPAPVRAFAAALALVVLAVALRGLRRLAGDGGWRSLAARHGPLLLGAALTTIALALIIGRIDYHSRLTGGPAFQQARYLLPALPVAVLVGVAALRGIGRRALPVVGVAAVSTVGLWAAAAWAITVTRYFG